MEPLEQPRGARGAGRIAFRLILVAAVLAFLLFGTSSVQEFFEARLDSRLWGLGPWLLFSSGLAFIVLLATPFVPGIELGLAMMMVFGVRGVAVVYLSTLVALSLSFAVGRWVPLAKVGRALARLRLRRASGLLQKIEALSASERLAMLLEASPGRLVPFLLRHRYLAVAVVLNLPGNAVIGGGGGIGILVGLSGIFTYPRYLAITAVAILPFPLFFLGKGMMA